MSPVHGNRAAETMITTLPRASSALPEKESASRRHSSYPTQPGTTPLILSSLRNQQFDGLNQLGELKRLLQVAPLDVCGAFQA